jgi:hypothetical protein
MKKIVFCLILLYATGAIAQKPVEVSLLKKEKVDWSNFIGIDRFNSIYYLKNAALEKNRDGNLQTYSNLQLGKIDQVHIFNALKIAVLHKNFNSVVLLDNRLAEIDILNFNNRLPYRLVTEIAYANESTLWLFNALTLQLELFDYKANKTKLNTLPFNGEVLALQSDYNNVYALTGSSFYHYNYTASLVSKTRHDGFEDFKLGADFIIFKKENTLFYKEKNNKKIRVLKIPKKTIKQFFVMQQTLYIYDGKLLYHYQLLNI